MQRPTGPFSHARPKGDRIAPVKWPWAVRAHSPSCTRTPHLVDWPERGWPEPILSDFGLESLLHRSVWHRRDAHHDIRAAVQMPTYGVFAGLPASVSPGTACT